MSSARLEGKTIIITGAGSGIGETASRLFAQHGAEVVIADINPDAADRVAKEIDAAGGRALAVGVDVTDLAANEAMVGAALAEFGKIDGIYVNAGVPGGHTAHGITAEEWQRVIAVNLTGAFYSAKAAVPVFLKQGHGNILFQASIVATNGIKGTVSYSASKAGVVGLTYQMAIEYADQGIRVNSISPGTTPTPLVQKLYTDRAAVRGTTADGDLERTAGSYPMKRLGTTEEIAKVALFMLSDDSSFITGTDIPVDGGFSAA